MNDQDERLVKIGAVKEEVKKVLMMSLGEVRWGQWEKYYPVLEAAIDALEPEAESRRSEEEIGAATERLRTHTIPYDPVSVAVILEYASGIDKNPEAWVRELFTPSGDKPKEETGETP